MYVLYVLCVPLLLFYYFYSLFCNLLLLVIIPFHSRIYSGLCGCFVGWEYYFSILYNVMCEETRTGINGMSVCNT